MRFRLILVAAITVLSSLLLTPSANAAAVVTQTSFSQYFEAGDGCTHEPGTLAGTVKLTLCDNSGQLAVAHSSLANTTYTTDSGSIYRLTDASGGAAIYLEGNPRVYQSDNTFNLVGADGQFHGHITYLIMRNADGETIVTVNRATFDCML
jgi:hypothetical protein